MRLFIICQFNIVNKMVEITSIIRKKKKEKKREEKGKKEVIDPSNTFRTPLIHSRTDISVDALNSKLGGVKGNVIHPRETKIHRAKKHLEIFLLGVRCR